MIRTLIVAAVLAAACGGKDKAAPAGPAAADEMKHEEHAEHGEHHGAMTPELTAFHDVLRPLWHAAAGPARMTDTCAAVPQFQARADALAKAVPPPTASADRWTEGTRALVAAVADLDAACKGGQQPAFDAAFSKLHDAFHALMMATQEHPKPGTGEAPPVQPDAGSAQGSADPHGGHAH